MAPSSGKNGDKNPPSSIGNIVGGEGIVVVFVFVVVVVVVVVNEDDGRGKTEGEEVYPENESGRRG